MKRTHRQIYIFLIVGFTTVAIDFAFYRFLLWTGVEIDVAKACSFTIGALFAYAANKTWTFRQKKHGLAPITFAILYGATLLVNTSTNGFLVRILPHERWAINLAFVAATGISAALNFIGRKWIVFRRGAA
jgi:putative flippase GtrA